MSLLDIVSIGFLSGLSGWTLAALLPNLTTRYPQLLAVAAGLFAYQGKREAVTLLKSLFFRVTGLNLS